MATIVLSLDHELAWGVQDTRACPEMLAVPEVVERLLDRFERDGIVATWAVVGALACEGWEEWDARAPRWPRYLDPRLAFRPSWRQEDPRLRFAPELVAKIAAAPGQELASHTFSHSFMAAPGFGVADAEADAKAMATLFEARFGAAPVSLVYPRNQVAHSEVMARHGVRIWRDNPTPYYWQLQRRHAAHPALAALRRLDAVVGLGRRVTQVGAWPHRSSHFVRFALSRPAWRLHLARIRREAASLGPDELLHLWWHPHDLARPLARGMGRLDALLRGLRRAAPGARFATMGELVGGRRLTPAAG